MMTPLQVQGVFAQWIAKIACDRLRRRKALVGARQKQLTMKHPDDCVDVRTWTAMDTLTKLVPCGWSGARTAYLGRFRRYSESGWPRVGLRRHE